ncbi:MAG: peptidylprolyl isomerase [Bacteroidia bacterium]
MTKTNIIPVLILGIFLPVLSIAQPRVLDKIIAQVGNEIILKSEVDAQYIQYLGQGNEANDTLKCQILDQMLLQKLLVHQARVDSVTVSEAQVEEELDKRIRYFVRQLGSEQKLEEFYNKSILEIKTEFKDVIRDQMVVQTMHQKITGDVTASPAQVKAYFERIPEDSIPFINTEVEVAHITKTPKISEEERAIVRARLEELRGRILAGEAFSTMAILYSQDQGSAKKGGELGFTERGQLLPEFEAVAYNLKGDEVSKIVETKFGFHIIQAIERRGDRINFRHLLIKPQVSTEDLNKAKLALDTLATKIRNGEISFTEAAEKYSDDTDTKFSGGLLTNSNTGHSKFETDQLDPALFFIIDKLKPGELSDPVAYSTEDDGQAYRIVKLRSRTEPHKANLREDYQRVKEATLMELQSTAIEQWMEKKKKNTYIQIDENYKSCQLMQEWLAN